MGDIDKLVFDLVFDAVEPYPPISPVWKKNKLFRGMRRMRKHIPKHPFGKQAGFNPAVCAGKYPVGFFQLGRRAALRALVIDKNFDGRLRLIFYEGGMPARRAESVLGRQRLSALNTGERGMQWVAALRTESGILGYGLLTFQADCAGFL